MSNPADNIKIFDNADEFRVQITDHLAGSAVETVRCLWETCMAGNSARRFAIDISHLTEYDHAAFALLHKMHLHGAHIVASTPRSLVVLNEISGPLKLGLALLGKALRQKDRSPQR